MMARAMRHAVLALAVVLPGAATAQVAADSAHHAWTKADVAFMQGMMHHHAQAILMAGWAPSHGASPAVQTLCARIIVSQNDEIAIMSRWLADRHQPVPDLNATHAMMPEMDPSAMMPGMLSSAQLEKLDKAHGTDFDELFLTDMIQHHQGAVTMVNALFAQGAGEEEPVYKIATGVYADQTTEIARMQKMLATELFAPSGR